ncbi:MAG: sialidase family protein [Candidatus Cryptobacteroides sp.]
MTMRISPSTRWLPMVLAATIIVSSGCSGDSPKVPEEEPAFEDDGIILRETLFENKPGSDIPYRIPALATYNDGTLVAIGDYRHGKGDIGSGRIDLHYRISKDNGKTWGEEKVLVEGDGLVGATCAYGDAAIASDCETNETLLITVCGSTGYFAGKRTNPCRVAEFRSNDKGETWTEMKEITEDIYSIFDGCASGTFQSCFIASGKIMQSRIIKEGSHYRLYAAIIARPGGNKVIFSDDFGKTWAALGGPDAQPSPNGNEAKCEELPDGRVVLSSRVNGGRYFNVFTYTDRKSGAGTWDKEVYSSTSNNGCITSNEIGTNGEILILPVIEKATGNKCNIALQSVPIGPRRSNVAIYFKKLNPETEQITSELFAGSWQETYRISDIQSAYSTMDVQANGRIGIFLEEKLNQAGNGYDLVYTSVPVDSLTLDMYRLRKSVLF